MRLAADQHMCNNSRKGKTGTDAQSVQDSSSAVTLTLKSAVLAQLRAVQLVQDKVLTERVVKQAVFWQRSCTEQSNIPSCLWIISTTGMQTALNATVEFRLTSVLHVGPVVALPNAPPVDDHST